MLQTADVPAAFLLQMEVNGLAGEGVLRKVFACNMDETGCESCPLRKKIADAAAVARLRIVGKTIQVK